MVSSSRSRLLRTTFRCLGSNSCRAFLLAYSQVREARTLLFGIKMVAWMSFRGFRVYMWLRMYGVNWFVVWVWNCVGGREEQWWSLIDSPRRTCLAQARVIGARLSVFLAKGRPGDPRCVLGERTSHAGSRALAYAKGARLSEGPPRLGETFLPERDVGREMGWSWCILGF